MPGEIEGWSVELGFVGGLTELLCEGGGLGLRRDGGLERMM